MLPRRSASLLACLLLAAGCPRAPEPAPASPALCGLPLKAVQGVRIQEAAGAPEVVVLAEPASFMLVNPGADERACSFELRGPGLGPERVFFRFFSETGQTGRAEALGPGRVRVSLPVWARGYNLVSVEPPVEPLSDPLALELGALRLSVEGGAFLRLEAGRPVVQSLGPATEIRLLGRGDQALPVALRIQNTSDRLSEPVAEGLAEPRFLRTGPLALEFTGTLPAGAEGRVVLRPRPLSTPWQFMVGGDVKEQLGIYMAVIEAARQKHDPLFLLAVGDYTRNSLPPELDAYFSRTAGIPFPTYPIMGNHETNCQGTRHYARLFGPGRYTFQVGQLFVAVLDSNRWDRAGYHLGAEQLDWLDRVLGAHREVPWKLVGLHVPPHPMHTSVAGYPGNMVDEDAARLKALAAAHGVAYVVSGHVHLHARAEEAGTVYLTSAGGGSRLDGYEPVPGMQFQLGPHMVVLTVGPGGIEEERVAPARPPMEVPR